MNMIWNNQTHRYEYINDPYDWMARMQREEEEMIARSRLTRIRNHLMEILPIVTNPVQQTKTTFGGWGSKDINSFMIPSADSYVLTDPSGDGLDKAVIDDLIPQYEFTKFRTQTPDGKEIEAELKTRLGQIRAEIYQEITPDFINDIISQRKLSYYADVVRKKFQEDIICAKFAAWGQMINAITDNMDFFQHCLSPDDISRCYGHFCNIKQWIWWDTDHGNDVSNLEQFRKAHYLAPRNFVISLKDLPDWN